MRSLLFILFVLCISCQHLPGTRMPSSELKPVYHGLSDVDLGLFAEWTQGLYAGEKAVELPSNINVNDLVFMTFQNSKDANDFLASLVALKLNKHYSKMDSYRKLAEGLYSVRKKMRSAVEKKDQYTRQAILILGILAEETLYAQYLRFPNQKLVRFDYAPINMNQCKLNGKKRSGKLNEVPLCQGDIVLSKGGAGSSSFIARIGDYPGNFSHSTIPYFYPETNQFVFIEAEIEDGIKLRSPEKDYINDKKAKLFVYRSKNPQTVKGAIAGVDKLYNEVIQKVGNQDPKLVASYDYDFAMDANESKKLFCSEVAYYAYQKDPLAKEDNPYNKKYWSNVIDPTRKAFLTRFLNTTSKFPAPSDVEFNPSYDLVAMQFDLSKFSNDRMMVALIDITFQVIHEHEQQMNVILDLMGKMGSSGLNPEEVQSKLQNLSKLGIKLSPNANEMVKKIPSNINFKQLLFFSFLNDVLAPKVREALLLKEKALLSKGVILDLEKMRADISPIIESEMQNYFEKIEQTLK